MTAAERVARPKSPALSRTDALRLACNRTRAARSAGDFVMGVTCAPSAYITLGRSRNQRLLIITELVTDRRK
jgi:hypothetical protein